LKRVLHLLSFAVSSFPVCLSQVFWKPDLVFCIAPTILTAPAALTTAFLSKAGSWLHIQDFEFEAARSIGYFNGKSFLWRIIRNGITGLKKGFDRISTISETMLDRLKAEGLPPEKLFLFPNWVDLSLIRYSEKTNGYRKEMNITSGDVVVLFSGSMTRKQSLHTVVDAARMLIRHKNIHFVLCGEGASRHEIEEQAYSLSNIHFLRLQPVEKLNHLMNMADIHLLPQAAAAADLVMPSKAAAILASGRPMIATVGKDTAVGKLVQNAGLIIPPEDPAAMAEAIEYLAANRDIRSEMGRRARMIAEDSFSASAIFANFFLSLEDFISVKG
jgi:colanic acid biosynthesis glycosyl transferase WcaI